MLFSMKALPFANAGGTPPVFRSATTQNASGVSSFTINKPSGVADGDFLAFVVYTESNGDSISSGMTGWTVSLAGSGNELVRIYTKVAASEPASYTPTFSGGPVDRASAMLAYSASRGSVDVVGATTRTTGSATGSASSLTATRTGVLLAYFANTATAATVSTPPSGMTQRTLDNSAGSSLSVYELDVSTPGPTGAYSLIWNTSGNTYSGLLQI